MSLTSDVLVWKTISLSEMASTSKLSPDDWAAILLWLGIKLTWINRNVRKCLLCVKRQCISMPYNQYILVEGAEFFFFYKFNQILLHHIPQSWSVWGSKAYRRGCWQGRISWATCDFIFIQLQWEQVRTSSLHTWGKTRERVSAP